MNVSVLVMTDGRASCIERTIPAAREHLVGWDGSLVIADDSGDPSYRDWLNETFDPEILAFGPGRSGFAKAVRRAQEAVLETGSDWVFWLEDDFVLKQDVDLVAIADVMNRYPYLSQMLLKRQAWFGNEIAAGGIIEANPTAYVEHSDNLGNVWTEHREGHWSNPHLVRSSFIESHEWPLGEWSESRFGTSLRERYPDWASAFWLGRDSEPLVEHIGEERVGSGY